MNNRLRLIPILLMLSITIAGCQSQEKINYSTSADTEDPFEKGADRPPSPETLYRMAILLEAQGKDDQAYAVHQNTIERYPDYVPSYCGLAALQVRQRKVAAGISTLETAHKLAPTDPVILNDIGMCWMLRGEHETAMDHFTRAAALAPDDARYRANMALATGMMGRYDEAYALYEQVMRPARAHYNLSVVAEARNDMAKADEEFAKARALDSTIERKPRAKAN